MTKESKYVVFAGDERPAYVDTNFLEKGSGQTAFKEGWTGGKIANRRGTCGIPTTSENWGVRLINGKIPSTPVDVKDANYKGEINFLPWGDEKGMLIMTRYIRGYNTLDYLYQNLVLNADSNMSEDDASSADAYFLLLESGENEFDWNREPFLALFVKNTAYNANSVSKNPQHLSSMIYEKNAEAERKVMTKTMDEKVDAMIIVKGASSGTSYAKLRNLFYIVGDLVGSDIQDELLYEVLLNLSDSKPVEFMDKMTSYKRNVSAIFSKATSYQVLDTTKDGVIVAGRDKKTIIAEEVPAKGEAMIQWIFENPIDPISFQAVHQLKQITEKLK
jgi:hypothetical protein